MLLPSLIIAQQCEGSLGDNLFVDGDFGSGFAYSISQDPGLAPGYSYNSTGPPNDGEYIITNSVAAWPFVFGTWLVIRDPSPDPNGYMMVVNASFEPGLFYREVIDGLCDNTSFEFSAEIINMIQSGVNGHILPRVEFLINDEVVIATGDIPQDEQWHRYSYTFSTDPGETSLVLSLRNNAPGGTGNDLALDNISFRACGPPGEIFYPAGEYVCEEDFPVELIALQDNNEIAGGFYQWERTPSGQNNWQVIEGQSTSRLLLNEANSGSHIFRFSTASSPESFENLKCRFYSAESIIETPRRTFEVFDTICGGTDLPFGDDLLNIPGLYIQELTSSKGCDSIVRFNLDTVRRATLRAELTLSDPLCFGESNGQIEAFNVSGGNAPYHIVVDNIDYSGLTASDLSSGNYMVTIKDKFGCFTGSGAQLNEPEQFVINLGEDRQIVLGEELNINVQGNQPISEIAWSAPLEDFMNMTEFAFLPLADLSVSAQATSFDDCTAGDALSIMIDTEVSLYVPNIFSPNSDGINDLFTVSSFGRSLDYISEFTVYDRWGGIVWQSLNGLADDFWDGMLNDTQLAASGVYAYTLTAILINGDEIKRRGTITLVY